MNPPYKRAASPNAKNKNLLTKKNQKSVDTPSRLIEEAPAAARVTKKVVFLAG
jgi:hypothetical protein